MEKKPNQMLNLERVRELQTWLKMTNTKLTQVNGQRRYGGPPEEWDGPLPGARCEVFISQIPRDAYEDLLIPLFSSVGPLWEFRLMMNFSGQNRGFAYAKYGLPAVAADAIRQLNGHMLEPGIRLSVRRSTEKRHLCVGELPASTRQEDLLQVLRVLTDGVERVSLKAGPGINGVSAIVAFSSHHAASMAKKVLVSEFKTQFSLRISIKWQSTMKPCADNPLMSPKPSNGLLLSPVKPPRHTQNCSRPAALPPRLARPVSVPPGFCRALGQPTASLYPHSPSPPSYQGHVAPPASSPSPMVLLCKVCEASGLGQPLYEIHFSHAGPDGFLNFTFKASIPGFPSAIKGLVMVLPGRSATATLEEARRAAAQQVLQVLSSKHAAV